MKRTESASRKNKVKVKFRHKHPILVFMFSSILVLIAVVGTGVASYVNSVLEKTPTITEHQLKSDGTWKMYDINGNVIASQSEITRDYVKIDDVPKTYIDFLLSTEDATFYTDGGFSKKGVLNMLITPILNKINPNVKARGGSSIEQQLIKNAVFTDNKVSVYERKIMELWLAQQLVENFSKNEILEFYVNKINLGENSYGIDTIAMTYYGQHIKEMSDKSPETLSKLAIIAGLGQAPSTYNLYDNPDAVRKRRDEVLLSALNNKKITEAQYQSTLKVDVTAGLKERYWRNSEIHNQTKKYNAYVTSVLEQIKAMGYDLNTTPLHIYTHLDPVSQDWLTSVVNDPAIYQDELQQSAVTVLDTKTGVVIAQSGGRNEEAYGLNRATQRSRSSGSTMKPFIAYGPAIEYFGYSSASTFDSSPYVYPGTNVVAHNYGGYTYGRVTMAYALQLSLNTPVNRLLDQQIGSGYAKQFLASTGLDVKETYAGSDALGINVSTADEAAAYASLANKGVYNKPNYIKSLTFADGSVKEISSESHQAMKESTAFILAKMLERTMEPNSSATEAKNPNFQGHLVKTGTVGYDMTDGVWRPDLSSSDKWISGATKSVTVSVWTGYDVPNEPNHWLLEGTNTQYALYNHVMAHFNQGKDVSHFDQPATVAGSGMNLTPTDVTVQDVIEYPDVYQTQGISATFDRARQFKEGKKSVIKDESIQKAPEGYKYQEWLNQLTPEDKAVYDKWKADKSKLIELKDLIDSRVFDNSQKPE